MAKKIRWVYLLKKLILCVSKPKTEKRSNGCRWIFQRFNLRQLPANSTPERTLLEVSEEQRKHAVKVARATAAAAEAAVAAAQAAAEVVRLTGVPESYHQHEKEIQNLAATRIQTAFRAYIARKAFRALKGIVGLQAIVRGRAVRRLVNFKLKHLPSVAAASIQSQIPAGEVQNFYDSCRNGDGNRSWICRNEMDGAKLECKREQQWNDSMFSEEEVESMSIRKLEAISRRNRMKQYSFSHRERHYGQTLEEALAYRNQWAEENVYRKERLQNTVQIIHSNPRIHDIDANLKLQSNSSPKGKSAEELSSPFSHPRRSISHTGQKSSIDDSLSTSSSSFPSYMAATESAKAKMRSISTPRQRKGSFDTCFRHDPCCQSMRCSWSYFNHVSSSIT